MGNSCEVGRKPSPLSAWIKKICLASILKRFNIVCAGFVACCTSGTFPFKFRIALRRSMSRSLNFSARMLLWAFTVLVVLVIAGGREDQPARTYLHNNWQIQSSCEVKAAGEQISSAGFDAKGWHKTDIPATVVGALVTDKTYTDPNYGTNLKSIPGMNHSDKHLFANQDMPEDSPFRSSWCYLPDFTPAVT